MIRVTAFTSGVNAPASRMRVRQFFPALRTLGVEVSEYPSRPEKYARVPFGLPKTIWSLIKLASRSQGFVEARTSDVVWLERELVVGMKTVEGLVGSRARRVLDVDDAIWMYGSKGYSEAIARSCAGVIAGNAHIAEHYRDTVEHVWIVPTSVDTNRWRPAARDGAPRRYVVGWTGTASNFPYLLAIEDALAAFVDKHDAEIMVVADRPPPWKKLPADRTRFVRWGEDEEVAAVRGMDVGLMPLANEPWALGKCAAKMLVYMAAGLPVVVSPVGVNAEILAQADVGYPATSTEEWLHGLDRLYDDRPDALAKGKRGRALVESGYSVEANVTRLAEVFRTLAGS